MAYIPEIYQGPMGKPAVDPTAGSEKDNNTLGQDQFLKLLVAQLQNQDPLNPTEPTEFTSQLAQYSQLEQLFHLNDSMEAMAKAQDGSDRISALSMIGKEIQVEGSTFMLPEEGSTEIGYKLDGEAAGVDLQIRNESGQTVATLHPTELSSGNHYITFNGLDTQGERLPAGKYTIVLQARSGSEEETVGATPLVRTLVTGVDLTEDGVKMVTDIGEFAIHSIHGVYDRQNPVPPENFAETDNESAPAAEEVIETAAAVAETVTAEQAEDRYR